jgi:hypothetical protein
MRRWALGLVPLTALAAVAACTAFSSGDSPTAEDAGDAGGFCRSQDGGTGTVVFCDDFDNPGRSSFELGCYQSSCWTHYDVRALGTLIDDNPFSAPRAVRLSSTVGAGDGGARGSRGAGLATIAFPADKTTLTLSAMIRPLGNEGPGERVLSLTYGSCSVEFAATGGFSYRCPLYGALPGARSLQAETWTHVSLSIQRTAQGESIRLVVGDGANAVVAKGDLGPSDGGLPSSVAFAIGNATNDSNYAIDYDDVLVVVE